MSDSYKINEFINSIKNNYAKGLLSGLSLEKNPDLTILRDILSIYEANPEFAFDDDAINIGSYFNISVSIDNGESEEETYTLIGHDFDTGDDITKINVTSRLGFAVLGKKEGDIASFVTPRGLNACVKVLAVGKSLDDINSKLLSRKKDL